MSREEMARRERAGQLEYSGGGVRPRGPSRAQRRAIARGDFSALTHKGWAEHSEYNDILRGLPCADFGRESGAVGQMQRTGPQQQRNAFVRAIKEYGLVETGLHYFEEVSGTKSRRRRTEWDRMLQDAEAGKFKVLVVHYVDRFARWAAAAWDVQNRLNEIGVMVLYLNPKILTPVGKDWQKIVGDEFLKAEEYSLRLSERLAEARATKWYQHGLPWGKPPKGFKWAPCNIDGLELQTWVVNNDPDDKGHKPSHCVPFAVELMVKGGERGLQRVCDQMNQKGCRTKQGSLWHPGNLDGSLRNKIYMGVYVHEPTDVHVEGVCEEVGPHRHGEGPIEGLEPLVSREDWEAVQKLLPYSSEYDREEEDDEDRPARKSREQENVHLFTDVAECGACANPYVADTNEVKGKRSALLEMIPMVRSEETGKLEPVAHDKADLASEFVFGTKSYALRHSPTLAKFGRGCAAGSVPEPKVAKEVLRWFLTRRLPDETEPIMLEILKNRSSGQRDIASERAEIEAEKHRLDVKYDAGRLTDEAYKEALRRCDARLAALPADPTRPVSQDFKDLAEAISLFGDPAVSRVKKKELVTRVFKKLVIVVTRRAANGSADVSIDWERSVVWPRFELLVHLSTYMYARDGLSKVGGVEGGSNHPDRTDSAVRGYDQFLADLSQNLALAA